MSALPMLKTPRWLALFALIFVALSLCLRSNLSGYALLGPTWPSDSTIVMQLSLGNQNASLQDGLVSWNGSAADALSIWNQHIGTVKFSWITQIATAGAANNVNDVFFSNTVYGETFGNATLAVTIRWFDEINNSVVRETDVIFNNIHKFNSYRGPYQWAAGYDLHRIALHEFGHVLGLAHPDQNGQGVYALMNSFISDFDQLLYDDIDGGEFLYGHKLTSPLPLPNLQVGNPFSYQLAANNHPTSYSAVGLPPGLQLDSTTGLISGTPTTKGTFPVQITAQAASADLHTTVGLVIWNDITEVGVPLTTLPIRALSFVSDSQRGRVYVRTSFTVEVIDVETLSIIHTFNIETTDISLSADGTRLWLAISKLRVDPPYNREPNISSIDLDTFAIAPEISVQHDSQLTSSLKYLREGWDQQLYFTVLSRGLYKFNLVSGTVTGPFPGSDYSNYWIEVSSDQKTLMLGDSGTAQFLGRYDISGAQPLLLQNETRIGMADNFVSSHNRKLVGLRLPGWDGPGAGYRLYDSEDLSEVAVRLRGSGQGPIAFSPDDRLVYVDQEIPNWQTYTYTSELDVYDPASGMQLGSVTVPGRSVGLWVDPTNSYLFFTEAGQYEPALLRIYRAFPSVVALGSKSLANVSTRSFVQTGSNVEIGGFILQGNEPKKLVLRAIGPSLSAYGLPAMSDPMLELHDSTGAIIALNHNWTSNQQEVSNTGLAPGDPREAVIVGTFPPGNYTAVLRGENGATGTALFELYDVDPGHSRVANISTRSNVSSGGGVMIGGFIIGGNQLTRVIVRAIGPSLGAFGISTPLQDPTLELRDGSGNLVLQNDDWQSDQQQAIINTGLAPNDIHESAIFATLSPGNYTAVVRGKDQSSGIALVEVYNLQ